MHINAHLDVDLVAVETEDQISVLLDLTAPSSPTTQARQPATLQVALDRSGSMQDGDRLEGAKKALLSLIDRLDPADNFGLVAFDNDAMIVVPCGPLTNKATVKLAIASIDTGGSTDLSGGYLRALQEARRVHGPSGATLLLISDGHANSGITDHDQLATIAAGGRTHGVTTTTLGFGLGYDEELLGAIADGGAGQALFAVDADTAGKLIAEQVEGLLSKVAQAASLTVHLTDPVAMLQVLGSLPSVQLPDGSVMIELGDLWADETRKLLLQFTIPGMAALGLATIAELQILWVELPSLSTHTATLPITVNVVPGDEAAGRIPNPVVRTELLFQQAQEAKRQASEALRRGDADAAIERFQAASGLVSAALVGAPQELVDELSAAQSEIDDLAERSQWADKNLLAKESHSSWHATTRRRGRPHPSGRSGK